MGYNGVYHIHTSIRETQVMISIEIHALNKVTSVHGCESLHRDVQISSMPQVTPLNLHATFYNNVKQFKKYCHGMSANHPRPPHPIVVNNIKYVLHGKLGCLENNNY
jgi:hypothetical protein